MRTAVKLIVYLNLLFEDILQKIVSFSIISKNFFFLVLQSTCAISFSESKGCHTAFKPLIGSLW